MPESKSQGLALVLQKLDPIKYQHLIYRAALNGYHDHKFDSIPGHPELAEDVCPKMRLVDDLSKFPELNHIRQEVMDGVYDDPADEVDQEEMRGWLMDDNAVDGFFSALGLRVPSSEERRQRQIQKKLN